MSFWQEFNARLRALGLALGVHGLMAALVVLGTIAGFVAGNFIF